MRGGDVAVHARRAVFVLRGRNWDGRRHLVGRSRWGAHADAVGRVDQCGFFAPVVLSPGVVDGAECAGGVGGSYLAVACPQAVDYAA